MTEAQEATQEDATASDTHEVSDLDEFVRILVHWHSKKVQILEHVLQVPEGTEMEFEGQTYPLTGDILKGLRAGINLSLIELGKLPFMAEVESEPGPKNETEAEGG